MKKHGMKTLWGPEWTVISVFLIAVGPLAIEGQEVRDSAGIEILVANPFSAGQHTTWTIEEVPELQIGEVDGEDPYLFMRMWDALRVPDGRIAIVEGSTFEIRIFGAEGRHEVTFGGRGDGPTEFGGPPWISLDPSGTLVVWDPGHHRLSRYSLSGDLLDQQPLAHLLNSLAISPFPNGRVWQVSPSGLLLFTGSASDAFPGGGLKGESRRVVLVDGIHETGVDLGTYPSGRTLWQRKGDGGLVGLPDPYAPFTAVVLGPEPFLVSVADSTRWEIRSFDREGALRRLLRSTIPPASVSREIRGQEKERALNLAEEMGMSLLDAERAFDRIPVPDVLPSIGSLFWDTSGNLWVGRRVGTPLEAPREYDVFDIQGHWLASVEVPESVGQIFEVGDDYVLATWQDELEVTYLRLYLLRKPSPSF